MGNTHWNRAGRKSGGSRPVRIFAPAVEVDIYFQREMIRREFGEAGVRRFDKELEKKVREAGGKDKA